METIWNILTLWFIQDKKMCPTIIVIQFMSKLFRVFLYHLLLLDCILKILKFQKKYKGIIWIHQNFRIWRGTHYPTERCAICIAGSFWHLPFWLKQKQEYWFFLNFYRSTNCKSVNNIIRTCKQIFRKIIWFSYTNLHAKLSKNYFQCLV